MGFRRLAFITGLALVCASSAAAGPAEYGVEIQPAPKDFSILHRYVYISVFPQAGGIPGRVLFQTCEQMSYRGSEKSVPSCEIVGSTSGYDLALVRAQGKKGAFNKGLFILRIVGETGMAIGAGYAPGWVGEGLGAAIAVLNIDPETGFHSLTGRHSRELIARAADGERPVLVSKRDTRDLFNDLTILVRNLEKAKARHELIARDEPAASGNAQKKLGAASPTPEAPPSIATADQP